MDGLTANFRMGKKRNTNRKAKRQPAFAGAMEPLVLQKGRPVTSPLEQKIRNILYRQSLGASALSS